MLMDLNGAFSLRSALYHPPEYNLPTPHSVESPNNIIMMSTLSCC